MTTPTPEELNSLADSRMRSDLRALATEITKQISDANSGGPFIKGIVSAVDWNSTPPLITVNVGGDTTTPIAGVRVESNYAPAVGQTVLMLKQGSSLLAVGHIADQPGFNVSGGSNGWIKADLANGSHNGNSNGDICYRRVLDHGSWKMQWRGGWTPSGATVVILGLAEEYRPVPSSGTTCIRTALCARDASGGSNVVKMDFDHNGNVTMVGGTVSLGGADGTTGSATTSSTVSHNHGGTVATSEITHNDGPHTHNLDASHVHAPTAPTWVSLNGVEYFL